MRPGWAFGGVGGGRCSKQFDGQPSLSAPRHTSAPGPRGIIRGSMRRGRLPFPGRHSHHSKQFDGQPSLSAPRHTSAPGPRGIIRGSMRRGRADSTAATLICRAQGINLIIHYVDRPERWARSARCMAHSCRRRSCRFNGRHFDLSRPGDQPDHPLRRPAGALGKIGTSKRPLLWLDLTYAGSRPGRVDRGHAQRRCPARWPGHAAATPLAVEETALVAGPHLCG